MAGPMRKPMPKAMPIRPNDLAQILGRRHVGDIGLGKRKIACREPIDDARQEDHPEGAREGENQETDKRSELADNQQRLAPPVIRHPAENGPGDELAERVGRNQQAHDRCRCAKVLRVKRKQRQNNREAEDVNQDDQKNGKEGRTIHGRGGPAEKKTECTFPC